MSHAQLYCCSLVALHLRMQILKHLHALFVITRNKGKRYTFMKPQSVNDLRNMFGVKRVD